MSYITSVSHGNYKDVARRQYLTTAAYDTYIYQHTITTNQQTAQTSGVLQNLNTVNSTLYNSTTCPANRVLIENGKKLFPNTALGVYQYMVGVYDPLTFTSGFIDPNDEIFAVMNTDKPGYLGRATNSVTGSSTTGEKAPPVYTDGTVTAGGLITGAVGMVATTGQIRVANAPTVSVTYSSGTASDIAVNIDPTVSQLINVEFNITGGTNSFQIVCPSANVPPVGSVVYLVLKTGSTHTTAAAVKLNGTNIYYGAQSTQLAMGTAASKLKFGVTFVSDGTRLIQVGGSSAPTAMET